MPFRPYAAILIAGLTASCGLLASGCATGDAIRNSSEKPFIDADRAATLLEQARSEFDAGLHAQSEQSLLLAVEENPFDGRLHYNLGVLALRRGAYETAVSRFERAAELMPQSVEPQIGIATVLLQTGRLGLAAEAFQRAIEIDPTNAMASSGLSMVLDRRDPEQSRRTNR